MRDAAPALELLPGQRESLEVIAKSTSAQYRQVQRARALLLAADGVANTVTCFSSNVAFRGFDQSTPGGSGRWLWI